MSSTITAGKPEDLNRQKKVDSESDWQPALKKDKKTQRDEGTGVNKEKEVHALLC